MLAQMPEDSPFAIKMGEPRTYKSARIIPVDYNVDFEKMMTMAGGDMADMNGMGEMEMFRKLMDNFNYEIGVAGKDMFVVMGSPKLTDKVVDRLLTGTAKTAEADRVAASFPEFTQAPVGMWKISMIKAMKLGASLIPDLPEGLFANVIDAGEGIVGASFVEDGSLTSAVRVSIVEIQALINAAQQAGGAAIDGENVNITID